MTLQQTIECLRYLALESKNAAEPTVLTPEEAVKKVRSLRTLLFCHSADLQALARQLEGGLVAEDGVSLTR